jgi:hypothetical protein
MIQRLRVDRANGFLHCSSSATLDQVRARAFALDPSLQGSEPDRLQAALLLLSADVVGQNVARLSRFTRLDATFVAKTARRLVDNGIWAGGRTLCAWHHPHEGAAAFRADVEVALGLALRRLDGEETMCWARPGAWRKPFEHVAVEVDGCAITYLVPEPPVETSTNAQPEGTTRVVEPAAVAMDTTLHDWWSRKRAHPWPVARTEISARRTVGFGAGAGTKSYAPLDVVASRAFPDAVWL